MFCLSCLWLLCALTSSDLLFFVVDALTATKAVVRKGQDQWYEIGLELGMEHAEIMASVHAIPSNAGKLRAIIETTRQKVGNESLVEQLMTACKNIPTPIDGDVRQELDVTL